jgi:malto-oligosyltrehalose trehalohydrolase
MSQPSYTFGPERLDAGRTRFRLWAPGEDAVWLELEADGSRTPLHPVGDGWFEATAAAPAGARYRFGLKDGQSVPDPASRRQVGDVHGWSVVVSDDYTWREADWTGRPWTEAVIYELHPGLVGGFKGVAAALPALADLGVTAVELMPIADFPGERNWGYDGVLPYAPDAAYGGPEALKALVDQAHGLGLMVFLDVVYNHFGPDGNYLPVYAPSFFRSEEATAWGGAIDFGQQPVRRFFVENALYWIHEFRFDGLRFDAVHAIKDPAFLDALAAEVRASLPEGRRVHLVLENDDNSAARLTRGFDAQWNDDIHHVLHVLLTEETSGYYADYADRPAEQLARALAEGFIYQGEPSPHREGQPRGEPSADLPPTAFVNFLQNHDQIGNRALGERLTSLSDPEALMAAIALLLLAPAAPLIFMGEEIGATTPFLYFTDHAEPLAEAVRQGRRKEFASFAGFAQAQDLPDPNEQKTFERSRPTGEEPGAAEDRRLLYKHLLTLRRERLTPHLAGARSLGAEAIGEKAVVARWRLGNGARLTVAVNLGAEAARWSDAPQAEILYERRPARSAAGENDGGSGALDGRSVRVWLEPGA